MKYALKTCSSGEMCRPDQLERRYEPGAIERRRWRCRGCGRSFHVGCPTGGHEAGDPFADVCDTCWARAHEADRAGDGEPEGAGG